MKKKLGLIMVLLLVAALAVPLVSAPAVLANAGVHIQVAMILDGSQTIDSTEWNIMLTGLAAALNDSVCVPHDGSMELTVIIFAESAKVGLGPVVITNANIAAVVYNITQLSRSGIGIYTCISCGLCLAANTLYNSPNFSPSRKQAINLVTDGDPNRCSCSGGTCGSSGSSCNLASAQASAVCARNYLLTKLGMTSDQDELDAEGIGITTTNRNWLRDSIVWPQPGYIAPPFNQGPGWVRVFATFQEFVPSLCEKFRIIIPEKYSLTMAANPVGGGTTTPTGTNPYAAGTVVNVTAVANTTAGYQFANWTAPVGAFGNVYAATTNFTMPAQNVTVTANFVKVVYNLTMAASTGGTATDLTGGSPYAAGTTVSINATAAECYRFANWTSSNGGTFGNANAAATNFTMPAQNVTVTANFEMLSYNLTVNSDGCCPITVDGLGSVDAGDSHTFTNIPCGTNVTLTADDSDPCCVFDYWSGNASGTNPIVQVTMSGNKMVTGHCRWLTYNLTVESDGCCPITVDGLGSVDAGDSHTFTNIPCGTNVTLTANNSTCCQFDSWNVTGGQFPTFGIVSVPAENTIVVPMDSNCIAVAYCHPICGGIGDTIYYDNNNNGTQDPGEGGIQGVTVQLYKDDGNGVFNIEATDELIDETTTDQDGEYEFPDLAPFCDQGYWVLVVESTLPPGVTLTTGSNPFGPICLAEEETYDIADFGYLAPTLPVGGTAYPINKLIILLPWMALAGAITAGIVILARRRRKAQS
jgi:hypothetical protein